MPLKFAAITIWAGVAILASEPEPPESIRAAVRHIESATGLDFGSPHCMRALGRTTSCLYEIHRRGEKAAELMIYLSGGGSYVGGCDGSGRLHYAPALHMAVALVGAKPGLGRAVESLFSNARQKAEFVEERFGEWKLRLFFQNNGCAFFVEKLQSGN